MDGRRMSKTFFTLNYMIPYGRQTIGDDDVDAVVETLRSSWLTQGPMVEKFEKQLAEYCGAKYAVVVCNGTAALHAAYFAAGFKSGDEFITSPMTFVATTNAGLWQGATLVLVDIDLETGNIDPALIEEKITEKTKAIVPVDYTGRPADLEKIKEIAKKYNLLVIEDACQALGAHYKGAKIGSVSDLTVFSFHPVKTITTGEGGAILTNNEKYYKRMKMFITHGVVKENFVYASPGDWYFEMQELGLNYRLTDFQCALGINQLKKADSFVAKRRKVAKVYDEAFKNLDYIIAPKFDLGDVLSSWHLYVARLSGKLAGKRAEIFKKLRGRDIFAQVHHIPIHHHPYYQKLGMKKESLPIANEFYESIISLPIFPDISPNDQQYVIDQIHAIAGQY